MKKMAFIIFGDTFTFPDGNAATNRVHTYAKGFKENNIFPFVICFRNEYTSDIEGTTQGIEYYYPFEQRQRSKYFLMRRWFKFRKYFTISFQMRLNLHQREEAY